MHGNVGEWVADWFVWYLSILSGGENVEYLP